MYKIDISSLIDLVSLGFLDELDLVGGKVKGGEAEGGADGVALVRVEEQRHSLARQVACE